MRVFAVELVLFLSNRARSFLLALSVVVSIRVLGAAAARMDEGARIEPPADRVICLTLPTGL